MKSDSNVTMVEGLFSQGQPENIEKATSLDARTVERFFCLALLQDGPDVTQRVLARFIDYRERKDEILAYLDGDVHQPRNTQTESEG